MTTAFNTRRGRLQPAQVRLKADPTWGFQTRPTHRRWREHALVFLAAACLTAFLLHPLSIHPGSFARVDSSDGQYSLWNVAWVARTIVADPVHVFDANIFYPHRWTLLYSEANLVAGLVAVPGYWATRSPYVAHNSVVLFAFFLSAVATYWLVVHLTNSRIGAAVSAICFAFCPFLFAHSTHIQLLMTPGIPLSMLAFHRLAEAPGRSRSVALGAAMAATAFCCAYYGVFMTLVVGLAVLFVVVAERRWRDWRFWRAVGTSAVVGAALVLPLFVPYALLQRGGAFDRPLDEAGRYSADWHSYLASGLSAHTWMLPYVRPWKDVAFPGFVPVLLGAGGFATLFRERGARRRHIKLYALIGVVAFWASFGPNAKLYSVLYYTMPGFTLMRAPVRLAIIVAFAMAVLAGFGVAALLARLRRPAVFGAVIAALAIAEHSVPLRFPSPKPASDAYRVLATRPSGPVIELPFFERSLFYSRHTTYMLSSTLHWMPLVNGYSDYFPPEFPRNAVKLAAFPHHRAFELAKRLNVRYAVFHLDAYDPKTRNEVEHRIGRHADNLRPLYVDDNTRLYEIVYP